MVRSHWKPFDRQKAIVASIVSVLKPGMANTPSIAQDRWICEQTVKDVAEIAMLKQFMDCRELRVTNLCQVNFKLPPWHFVDCA